MSVCVKMESVLTQFTRNQRLIEVDGGTVGDCLNQVVDRCPEMKSVLFRDDGSFLHYVVVCVNGETTYPDLARSVADGDEIQLIPIITGG